MGTRDWLPQPRGFRRGGRFKPGPGGELCPPSLQSPRDRAAWGGSAPGADLPGGGGYRLGPGENGGSGRGADSPWNNPRARDRSGGPHVGALAGADAWYVQVPDVGVGGLTQVGARPTHTLADKWIRVQ